jgi:DNA modification methylase
VQTVVTSPPYWGLRDYGTAEWQGGDSECDHKPKVSKVSLLSSTLVGSTDTQAHQQEGFKGNTCPKCGATRIDNQLGLEKTPEEYIEKMVKVFRECRRVLRDDGTVWLNMGDSYNGSGGAGGDYNKGGLKEGQPKYGAKNSPILKPKDLCGIPWRVALALQADGWYLRSDIIWSKPNPMPESVTDRPTKAHEYLFLLTKKPKYYYDADAVREKGCDEPGTHRGGSLVKAARGEKGDPKVSWHNHGGGIESILSTGSRNRRTVWEIPTQPYSEAHFATFPEKLVEPCIMAGTSERGCCPDCGMAWTRVTANKKGFDENGNCKGCGEPKSKHVVSAKSSMVNFGKDIRTNTAIPCTNSQTLGWKPQCECNKQPVPCIAMDPFMGSGTVAKVALRANRRFVGFELKQEYIDMGYKRIGSLLAQEQLL